jgi:hypothetical protein
VTAGRQTAKPPAQVSDWRRKARRCSARQWIVWLGESTLKGKGRFAFMLSMGPQTPPAFKREEAKGQKPLKTGTTRDKGWANPLASPSSVRPSF